MVDTGRIYSTKRWRDLAARAKARDGHRCSVSRLLGGECRGRLHSHHIVPVRDGGARFDLDNVGTACQRHHPMWESLRRALVAKRVEPRPVCRHAHRSLDAQLICEANMARRRARLAA